MKTISFSDTRKKFWKSEDLYSLHRIMFSQSCVSTDLSWFWERAMRERCFYNSNSQRWSLDWSLHLTIDNFANANKTNYVTLDTFIMIQFLVFLVLHSKSSQNRYDVDILFHSLSIKISKNSSFFQNLFFQSEKNDDFIPVYNLWKSFHSFANSRFLLMQSIKQINLQLSFMLSWLTPFFWLFR